MKTQTQENVEIVLSFNKDFIEKGNLTVFENLMDKDFVNQSAPPDSPVGPEGILYFFNNILRPAFPDLKVEIQDQIAEGDKVSTRKRIYGTHTGDLMGIKPTHKAISIDIIDIMRIRNGKLIEHWGINTFPSVMDLLKAN